MNEPDEPDEPMEIVCGDSSESDDDESSIRIAHLKEILDGKFHQHNLIFGFYMMNMIIFCSGNSRAQNDVAVNRMRDIDAPDELTEPMSVMDFEIGYEPDTIDPMPTIQPTPHMSPPLHTDSEYRGVSVQVSTVPVSTFEQYDHVDESNVIDLISSPESEDSQSDVEPTDPMRIIQSPSSEQQTHTNEQFLHEYYENCRIWINRIWQDEQSNEDLNQTDYEIHNESNRL